MVFDWWSNWKTAIKSIKQNFDYKTAHTFLQAHTQVYDAVAKSSRRKKRETTKQQIDTRIRLWQAETCSTKKCESKPPFVCWTGGDKEMNIKKKINQQEEWEKKVKFGKRIHKTYRKQLECKSKLSKKVCPSFKHKLRHAIGNGWKFVIA